MFTFRKRSRCHPLPRPSQVAPTDSDRARALRPRRPLKGPHPDGFHAAMFGIGCFWGAERKFWELGEGIHVTAVGYAGGHTPNPTYEEVCSGRTGHNEVVQVIYRSEEDFLRVIFCGPFGRTTIRPRECVRATTWGRSIAPASMRPRPAQRKAAEGSKADLRSGAREPGILAPSPPRSSMRHRSFSPRTITSSIWPRTPWVIAGSAVPA